MVAQSIKMALKAILANKTRSFLTMLGIIIGVFSLVVLVALVNGATGYITDSISSFGNDYIEIDIMKDKGKPLDDTDLAALQNTELINEVTPDIFYPSATLDANGKEETGALYAATSAYFRINKFKVQYGRLISAVDNDNHVKVAVISSDTAKKLYGREDAVGETLKVNGENFKVIGVLESTEGTFTGILMGSGNTVYIPVSCYTRMPGVRFSGYSDLLASVEEGADIEAAKNNLSKYFYDRFDNDKEAYSVITMDEISSVMNNVTTALAAIFGGVAAISLLVGGIGIMNIMLVSVTERTREIGIRKAIGASTKSILLQFLIEAFVISLTGCLIGLLFSYLVVGLINLIVGILDIKVSFSIPLYAILTSAGFSLLVGLVFGLYPANKAATKKPIEALRYDG